MIRSSIRSTFLPTLIVGGFCCIWALYGFYLFIGLCAFALTCRLLAPVARRRGWGAEGRGSRGFLVVLRSKMIAAEVLFG
jgi:hypothetical protein